MQRSRAPPAHPPDMYDILACLAIHPHLAPGSPLSTPSLGDDNQRQRGNATTAAASLLLLEAFGLVQSLEPALFEQLASEKGRSTPPATVPPRHRSRSRQDLLFRDTVDPRRERQRQVAKWNNQPIMRHIASGVRGLQSVVAWYNVASIFHARIFRSIQPHRPLPPPLPVASRSCGTR